VRLTVAYGTDGLAVDVPDDAVVVEPKEPAALVDEAEAVRDSLRHPISGPPLGEVVDRDGLVAVVFPDLTRPMPNTTVLPPLLAELERAGAGPDRVELLCATGTHRQATPAEMEELVGSAIARRYRIHDHASGDGLHVRVGEVEGTPVLLDRHYVEAAVRIVTGFVEPHFFAGWSGGPKGVCPGLADTATILEAHSPARLADARATWMLTKGHPVHEFVVAAAALCPPDLSVDVTIDGRRRLTGVFAGALPDSHRAACAFAADTVTQPVEGHFDVVLTTNGGYPLDRNLYQAVKGMAAAERVVAPGGIIVMAAACDDGLPDDGAFARILRGASGPAALLHPRGPGQLDAWQAQVLARVLGRAEVWMFSEGLSHDAVRSAMLSPVDDLGVAVARALDRKGPGARLCVLPHGPLTVATSSGSAPVG
jgi:nickel-dependent lactate racemase